MNIKQTQHRYKHAHIGTSLTTGSTIEQVFKWPSIQYRPIQVSLTRFQLQNSV